MNKEQLLSSIEREIILLKRLIPLIEEKDLNFRPAEKMRSTYELMQYLSGVGGFVFRWLIKNDVTPDDRKIIADYRATLTLENFSQRLDDDFELMKVYMNNLSEEDLHSMEVELPWKEKMFLGQAIINAPVKWLATYRMQLFMNLKMNGHSELATKDAWVFSPAEN